MVNYTQLRKNFGGFFFLLKQKGIERIFMTESDTFTAVFQKKISNNVVWDWLKERKIGSGKASPRGRYSFQTDAKATVLWWQICPSAWRKLIAMVSEVFFFLYFTHFVFIHFPFKFCFYIFGVLEPCECASELFFYSSSKSGSAESAY